MNRQDAPAGERKASCLTWAASLGGEGKASCRTQSEGTGRRRCEVAYEVVSMKWQDASSYRHRELAHAVPVHASCQLFLPA